MFFPKLRRNAKWMFLFLALVFGLGFVGFGVGAGGVGIGDVFRGASGSGVPSIDDAEERVSENPRDAAAFRDLATAHQAEGNTDDAIEALESFVALKPKNAGALVDLASLYLIKVEDAQRRAQIANVRAAYLAPGATISSIAQFGGRPLDADAISSAVNTQLSQVVQTRTRRGAAGGCASGRRVQASSPRPSRATPSTSSSSPRRPNRRATSRRQSLPTRSSSSSSRTTPTPSMSDGS